MRLVSFSVRNYRSITKAHKLGLADSTILIGPNNEGKSNLLRALATALEVASRLHLLRIVGGRIHVPSYGRFYVWERDFPIPLQHGTPDGESVLGLEFALTDADLEAFREEVKSHLNGALPIEIHLGRETAQFKVVKRGPGGKVLSDKMHKIARFIGSRLSFESIPAIRTARAATRVVEEMVDRVLAPVETDPAYRAALSEISRIQKPVLQVLSDQIAHTLREFLPGVRNVEVQVSQEAQYRALRRSVEIVVDDGTPTPLERKGDGVQSLAALSLLRGARQEALGSRDLILAIEEPESHLHPRAIHRLRAVIEEISSQHQVIITTHCPLFVDRVRVSSNILVEGSKATPAKNISEVREALGVRASDNLLHAEIVLVVEGEGDRSALSALLGHNSPELRQAIRDGVLGVHALRGVRNLVPELSHLIDALCRTHVYLDNDGAAVKAATRAQEEGILDVADVQYAICDGMAESELEDLYAPALYEGMVKSVYAATLDSPRFRSAKKWSERMSATFRQQGKQWDDAVEADVKSRIAALAVSNPAGALLEPRRSTFDALVKALEEKIMKNPASVTA